MKSIQRTLGLVFLLSVQIISADFSQNHVDTSSNRAKRSTIPFKLRIVTIENAPYMSYQQGGNGLNYVGFIPDLITEMSRRLNFDFEFYPVPDGKYGMDTGGGVWSGMIGEVMNRQYQNDTSPVSIAGDPTRYADMAAAPLTVTAVREQVIDFVKPFHHLGLTLVVQKAYLIDNSSAVFPLDFSIFKPLSPYVWLLTFIMTVVVGVLLGVLNRFNPYEWGGAYLRGQADETERDSFGWAGALWFTFTTIQWQGFERAPRSIAAKCLTFFWFFFVTLTLVTYIGALVNHLWWASMIQRHDPSRHKVSNLEDIVGGNFQDFKVGAVGGGSTYRYVTKVAAPKFQEFGLLKNYWATPDGSQQLCSSTQECIQKVRQGNFACMMETMSARFEQNKAPCDLTTVGPQFGLRSYGLAVPRGSPFLEMFHQVILELQEEGEIDAMEQTWWEGQGECWNVTSIEETQKKANEMYVSQAEPKVVDLQMYWSVIVTLVVGILISLVIAGGEILYYRYRGRHDATVNRANIQSLPKMENDEGYGRA